MNHPLVTVCMPTFGRPELLEEAIEGFLRQTWPNKRLIIGNDYGPQTLVCEHPLITVINRAERFTSLGAKRNWLMNLAGEGFVTHWDDDDIYLPSHIDVVMALMQEFGDDAARQFHCWLDSGHAKYRMIFASYVHTLIASRAVYREVGDYPLIDMNEDGFLLKALLFKHKLVGPPHRVHEPTFVLRQEIAGRKHMTDFGDRCHEKLLEEVQAQGVSGVIELRPHWIRDYTVKAAASWAAVQEAA